MANTKITELTAVTALAGTDVFPVVDVSADTTNKVSVEDLLRNAPDGTAGAPSIANAGDQDTGILFPAANSVGVSTGGTQRFVIDSSGRIGIGTTTPSAKLHVTGTNADIHINDPASSNPLRLTQSGVNAEVVNVAAGDIEFGLANDGNIKFVNGVAKNERMRLDLSGNLKLGGTLPSSPNISLNANGSARFTGSVSIGGTAAANIIDEYEEGSWTPGFSAQTGSFTALTLEIIKATYTKVGRIVTVQAFIRTDNYDETGASGNLEITGLPFASQSGNSRSIGSPLTLEYNAESSFTGTFAALQPGSGTTTIRFARVDEGTNSGSINYLQVDQLQTTSSANRNWMTFSLTYQAA